MRRFFLFAAAALSVTALALGGCNSQQTESDGDSSPADSTAQTNGEEDGLTDMEKMEVELAKLPQEDRASAQKQHICPVSGEMLGTMGPPLKVDVNGEEVWICCESCRKPLLENPEDYLSKLSSQ